MPKLDALIDWVLAFQKDSGLTAFQTMDLPDHIWKLCLDAPELARACKKMKEALKRIHQQDRQRGYPTGTEWMAIVTFVRAALEEVENA